MITQLDLSSLVRVALGALPATQQRLFACRVARRSLEGEQAAGGEPHSSCWDNIETAERYAVGQATGVELAYAFETCIWSKRNDGAASWVTYYESTFEAADRTIDCAAWAAESRGQERATQLIDLWGTLAR